LAKAILWSKTIWLGKYFGRF